MSIIVRQYKNAGKAALLILCVSALLSSVAAETHAPEASAANESAEPSPPKQEPLTLENAVYMLQNPFRYSHEAEIFYQGKRQQIYIGMGNCAASLNASAVCLARSTGLVRMISGSRLAMRK